MTVASEAMRLHALGFEPIALIPGDKRPLDEAWQTLRARSPEVVAADFAARPTAGLGLLTGGGLVVIDADYKPDQGINGQARLAELAATLGSLPKTVTARTAGGGFHYYFKVPADCVVRNSQSKLAPGIDTRGRGGYVVAPPTVLADGREYRWLESARPGVAEVADLPARWLEALQKEARHERGEGNALAPVAPGMERLTSPVTRAAGLARARAYLAAMPGAVAGQAGHKTTFDAACRAVERCTTADDAALALWEYNQRCVPPWEEWELKHKLEDALKRHQLASAMMEEGPAGAGVAAGAAPVSGQQPGEPAGPSAVLSDDDIDRITEQDNAAYWRALRAYNRDNPTAPLPEVLSQETADLLKRTPRPSDGTPGRPSHYLDKKSDILFFHAFRPSTYAFDEHKKGNPWRRFTGGVTGGRWSDGATREALEHELANGGLNQRSRDEFRRRVRHVEDALHVYDDPRAFVERHGRLVLNVYEPSTLAPAAGDWSAIREVLLNLHAGRADYLEWTLDWLATIVRDIRAGKPRLPGVAVIFYGPVQGVGKGVFGEVIRSIVGPKNLVTIRQQELDEPYNAWAAGRLFVIANEVYSTENRTEAESNKLKPYISDDTVQIREMYAMPKERKNVAAWMLFSNNLRPAVVEGHDRRLTLFKVGGALDPVLGERVADDARAGGPGVQAFLHELMTREVKLFRRYTPLVTDAKSEVSYDTSSSAEKFVTDLTKGDGFHALAERYIAECGGSQLYVRLEDGTFVERGVAYEVYRRWALAHGYRALAASQLYRLLRAAGATDERRRVAGKPVRLWGSLPGVLHEAPVIGALPSGSAADRMRAIEQGKRNVEAAREVFTDGRV